MGSRSSTATSAQRIAHADLHCETCVPKTSSECKCACPLCAIARKVQRSHERVRRGIVAWSRIVLGKEPE